MTDKRVLVAGATGRLGVVVNVLLDRGHSVRAMTRDPTSSAAARLRAAGAEIVYGDFDDPDSIAGAATGVNAMFATGTAHRAGPDGELRHARNIARAAAAAGVPHLVYSSGDGAAPDSPLPLFRVKHQVEQYIRALPITHTILAPVYFMENLLNPWNLAALRTGVLPSPIDVDLPLQQAAIADVASLAALAIERQDEFAGQRIRIASDELTASDAADVLARVSGRPFTANRVATDELGLGLRSLFAWLERTGHDVDIPGLHERYPQIGWHTYEEWLRSERPRLAGLCPHEHAAVNSATAKNRAQPVSALTTRPSRTTRAPEERDMTERGKQLHASADQQITELAGLIQTLDEPAVRLPCGGREKLGDGTVGACAQHTTRNYQRIGTFVAATDRGSDGHTTGHRRGHRIPRLLRAFGHQTADHRQHGPDGHAHDEQHRAENTSRAELIEELKGARENLSRIAELTDRQLDAVPPKDSFRFCDGQRTLEQVLTGLLKHQDHQVRALKAAIS